MSPMEWNGPGAQIAERLAALAPVGLRAPLSTQKVRLITPFPPERSAAA